MQRMLYVFAAALCLVPSAGLPQAQTEVRSPVQGTWQITAVIDDGRAVPLREVRDGLAASGRVTISGNTIRFPLPDDRGERVLPFVTDATQTPGQIDVTTASGQISRGIFEKSGDLLVVCLAQGGAVFRPAEFSSEAGSGHMLMVLQAVREGEARPGPQPLGGTVPVAATDRPAPQPGDRDEQYRKMLVGTWGHQNSDEIVWATLNPDGTFGILRESKKVFQKIFDKESRASGTWKVENGSVVLQVTASDRSRERGQVFALRVVSLTATDVVYIDDRGQSRREFKVR